VPPLTSPAEYAVVQIRQDGYIQTVGANTGTTTSMIYGTCWASFKLAP
jgi:folate-dependent tRNA-U54 methylase TrmFO/GidA